MSTHLIDGIVKALATLAAHNIIPGSLEVTRATYQQLKAECSYPNTDPSFYPNHFMGVRIVIRD